MPGLNGARSDGNLRSNTWDASWKCDEVDQVVQRFVFNEPGGIHRRSRSDLTPFKEAMEGRMRHSPGVRPSFEDCTARVKEEAPS